MATAQIFNSFKEALADKIHNLGSDTLKFMLCLFWLVSAWRCSHNVGSGFWRGMGRLAIALSVLFVGLTY